MSDEQAPPIQKLVRLREVNAGKGVASDGQSMQVREGANASAPANFKLPDPVKMPAPPKNASETKK
jgi:hypothetical protein